MPPIMQEQLQQHNASTMLSPDAASSSSRSRSSSNRAAVSVDDAAKRMEEGLAALAPITTGISTDRSTHQTTLSGAHAIATSRESPVNSSKSGEYDDNGNNKACLPKVDFSIDAKNSSSQQNTTNSSLKKRRFHPLRLFSPSKSNNSKSSTSSSKSKCHKFHLTPAIWMGRLIFVGFLCVVAAVLGISVYLLQAHAETSLAESQFEAIADRAIASARDITNRKILGAISLTSLYSNLYPTRQEWPFVYLKGFQAMGGNIVATSRGRGVAFAPIVRPEEVQDFEDFAYQHIPSPDDNITDPLVAESFSSFGKGIFAFDSSLNNTDKRYHDITGTPLTYESPYPNLLMPILQSINPDPTKTPMYLLN